MVTGNERGAGTSGRVVREGTSRAPQGAHPGAARVAIAGVAAVGVTYGFARYGYGLFLPELRAQFGLSTQLLGLVASGSYAGYLCALVLTGLCADRYGARAPVVVGCVLATVGMALIALTDDVRLLAAGVVVAGSSAGCTWAPFSDVVEQVVRPPLRRRTLAVISTGTTFGLVVAAPVALFARGAWRLAWVVFAAVALAAAVQNYLTLPRRPVMTTTTAIRRVSLRWFAAPGAGRLVAVTLAMSASGAVYWTYAVDLVHQHGTTGVAGPLLWGAVGVAGASGVAAGDASLRFGLRRCLVALHLLLGAGILLLSAAPSALGWVLGSAVLFGASYMGLAALIVILGTRIYASRPSLGFSSTMLVIALGAIVGPVAAGALAGGIGLRPTFAAAAVVALSGALAAVKAPRRGRGVATAADPLR